MIPSRFRSVHYVGRKYPGNAIGLREGANCQHFVYELLRHYGYKIPDFRSSQLWEDRKHTRQVRAMRPLDLLLFNPNRKSWGTHFAICVGPDRFLHLCREIGRPVVWTKAQFHKRARYHILIGIKRMKRRG